MLTIVMQICVFFWFESCVANIPGSIYLNCISVALCMSCSHQWTWYSFIKDEGQDQYQNAPFSRPPSSLLTPSCIFPSSHLLTASHH